MASIGRYAGSFLSDNQVDGASFLIRGIPRSFLVLLALFLLAYAGYWAAVLVAAPGEVQEIIVHVLGLLLGVVTAVTLLRIWPRLEVAVPRWFRGGDAGPALKRHHKYLAWTSAVLVAAACALWVTELTYLAVIIMGLSGGIYILFRVEAEVLKRLPSVRERFPWMWSGSGWRVFGALIAVMFVLIVIATVAAIAVGSNEYPDTHVVKFLPTLAVVFPGIVLAVHLINIFLFMVIQLMRTIIARKERQGRSCSARQRALRRAHPASLTYYISLVNYSAAGFLFAYVVLLLMQTVSQARSKGAYVPIDFGGALLPGELLDWVALASFAVAWVLLLLSLSGAAARGTRRLLNRRVFASLSVFFVMVLFMQVVVAHGDEFTISVAFRAMYIVGIVLAPLLIYWNRWKAVGRGDHGPTDPLPPDSG